MTKQDWSIYAFCEAKVDNPIPRVEDKSDNFLVTLPTPYNNGIVRRHPKSWTLQNNSITFVNSIFFTVTPSDSYVIPLNEHLTKQEYEDHFRATIIEEFKNVRKWYLKRYGFECDIHIHFEMANRLHSHGVITYLPEAWIGYDVHCKTLSKRFHKIFGKPRLNSSIAATFLWCDANWDGSYLVKAPYLKSELLI